MHEIKGTPYSLLFKVDFFLNILFISLIDFAFLSLENIFIIGVNIAQICMIYVQLYMCDDSNYLDMN